MGMLYSETWPPVGLQLIFGIPPWSTLSCPNSVGSTLQATRVVTPSGYYPKFLPWYNLDNSCYLLFFCITYKITNKYYAGEPINIHIQSLINIIQENN